MLPSLTSKWWKVNKDLFRNITGFLAICLVTGIAGANLVWTVLTDKKCDICHEGVIEKLNEWGTYKICDHCDDRLEFEYFKTHSDKEFIIQYYDGEEIVLNKAYEYSPGFNDWMLQAVKERVGE